jgi:hypothetical protein
LATTTAHDFLAAPHLHRPVRADRYRFLAGGQRRLGGGLCWLRGGKLRFLVDRVLWSAVVQTTLELPRIFHAIRAFLLYSKNGVCSEKRTTFSDRKSRQMCSRIFTAENFFSFSQTFVFTKPARVLI